MNPFFFLDEPLQEFSITASLKKLYEQESHIFPKVRCETSLMNNEAYSYNLLIDSSNSLSYSQQSLQNIQNILESYIEENVYFSLIQDFLFGIKKGVSFGVNMIDNKLNFNLCYGSTPLLGEEVRKLIKIVHLPCNVSIFDNQKYFCSLNFTSTQLVCLKIYSIHSNSIDFGNHKCWNGKLKYFQNLGENYFSLTRYYFHHLPHTYKLYINTYSKNIFLKSSYIKHFIGLGFSAKDIQMFQDKRIVSIASSGGNNLELYFDLMRNW